MVAKLSQRIKKWALRWLWPLMPGWPDEGRRIVQRPLLQALLQRATQESQAFTCVFNAGSGEGGYSPLLLGLPGVQLVLESDFGFTSGLPTRIHSKQVFFCSSLVSIPITKGKVDLVLCTEVLEHIHEHEQALDEVARVMAPGGWLLITVPTPPAVPDAAHAREGYRFEELSALLRQRGFEIVDQRVCMYFFFRFILANWAKLPWRPRIFIRALSFLDRLLPIGPPMDLMILARLAAGSSNRRPQTARVGLQ